MHNSGVHSRQEGGKRTNELLLDKKFVEICKKIGLTPKYQYQLMQIVLQLKSHRKELEVKKEIILYNRK